MTDSRHGSAKLTVMLPTDLLTAIIRVASRLSTSAITDRGVCLS